MGWQAALGGALKTAGKSAAQAAVGRAVTGRGGGKKSERRERVSKIMGVGGASQGPSVSSGTGTETSGASRPIKLVSPTIDRVQNISKSSGSNTFSDESVENISIIASKLIDINTILKGSLVLDKMREKKKKQAAQRKKRNLKEKALEKLKSTGKGIKDQAVKATGGVRNWLNKLVFSFVMIGLMKLAPLLKPLIPVIAAFVDGALKIVGWIGKFVVTLIHWAYKAYDGFRGFVKNIFGEEGVKKFDSVMGHLNGLFNAILMVGMAFLKFGFLRKIFRRGLGKVLKRGAIKIFGKGGGKVVQKVGQKLFGATGKGIMKHGVGRAAKRAALKMFGKTATKIFGRIPIIGPLIVGIVSLLSGEPVGQALFKTFGAAIGGFLGTFIPIPILGTIIGEIIGTFVGDMFYSLLFKGGLGALGQKLMNAFKGITEPIFEFFGSGFKRFTEDFPTITIPDISPGDILANIIEKLPGGSQVLGLGVPFTDWSVRGLLKSLPSIQEFLGFFAKFVPGLNNYVEDGKLTELPNLLLLTPLGMPFLIPHVAKSFLPGMFGGSSDAPSASAESAPQSDDKEKKEEKGIQQNKLVSSLRARAAEKKEEEDKAKAKAEALKSSQVAESTKNIQDFMGKPLDPKTSEVAASTSPSEVASSVEGYPSYDSAAGQTAMLPLPPQIIPGPSRTEEGLSLEKGGSGGSEDYFEALYAGRLA